MGGPLGAGRVACGSKDRAARQGLVGELMRPGTEEHLV